MRLIAVQFRPSSWAHARPYGSVGPLFSTSRQGAILLAPSRRCRRNSGGSNCAARCVNMGNVAIRLCSDSSLAWGLESASGKRHLNDAEECSSMARAPVSKTGGWGFESLHSCHLFLSNCNYLKLFRVRQAYLRCDKYGINVALPTRTARQEGASSFVPAAADWLRGCMPPPAATLPSRRST